MPTRNTTREKTPRASPPPREAEAEQPDTRIQRLTTAPLLADVLPEGAIAIEGEPGLIIWPDGRIVKARVNRYTGEAEIAHLLWSKENLPIVHSRSIVIRGGERLTLYDVEIAGRRDTFDSEDVKMGRWQARYPELPGVAKGRSEVTYLAVITQLATKAPLKIRYEAPGWQWVPCGGEGERYRYITPDGRVVGMPSFSVDVEAEGFTDTELDLWRALDIEAEAPTRERQEAAYNLLRDLSARRQPLLNFTHAFLALLAGVRSRDFALGHFLVTKAERASGKTSLAGAARGIISPLRWNGHTYVPDARYGNTTARIESDLATRRHMPAILDDLHGNLTEGEDTQGGKTLDALARSLFEGVQVRGRMTQHMRRQKGNMLEGAYFSTQEQLSKNTAESLLRRVLLVTLRQTELNKKGEQSLESLNAYSDVFTYWGYQLIRELGAWIDERGQSQAPRDGLRLVAGDLLRQYQRYQEALQARITTLWKQKHPHMGMPEDVYSLVEIGAAEMLAFRWWQDTSEAGGEDSDLLPALVDTLIEQIEQILGLCPDDEEGPLFQRALLGVLDEIAHLKLIDRQRARVVARIAAPRVETGGPDNDEQAPRLRASNGELYARQQWGWDSEYHRKDSDREQVSNLPRDVAYVGIEQDDTPSRGKLYLTSDFTMMMLAWLREHKAEGAPTTEKALTALAEREGWIIERGNGRHIRKNVTQHGRVESCLVIDLARALALIGSPEEEPLPTPPLSPDDRREVNELLAPLDLTEETEQPTEQLALQLVNQRPGQAPQSSAPCIMDCGRPGKGYTATGVWLCRECASTLEVRIVA